MRRLIVVGMCCLAFGASAVWGQSPVAKLGPPVTVPPEDSALPTLACCPACSPCGPPGNFWVSGDYILWATRGNKLPPLVTAAPAGSTAAVPGALGNPDTVVLFGDQRVNDNLRSGLELRAGFWLDDCHQWGLDGSFFYLNPTSKNFGTGSDGTTLSLFRPIFNTTTGMFGAEDVANRTDFIRGQIGVSSSTDFAGGDVNLCRQLCCCNDCCRGRRIDLLTGFRIFGLDDNLLISENLTTLDLAGNPNGSLQIQDRFRTSNEFYGWQAGLHGQWWWNRWFLDARGMAAIGLTHESVEIEGTTIAKPLGGPAIVQQGGLLALASNIGKYQRDPFTFSPSLEVKLGCAVTQRVRVWLGYDFLYTTSVVRAGSQIDLTVNPNLFPPAVASPGTLRPAFAFHGSDFWAQGMNVGLELRF